ncbi:MAG TPA: spore germination protein [Symbiobacteriaceae bacterium]|nr:spore germination protein [Symbiobacteriaceae bacterium]
MSEQPKSQTPWSKLLDAINRLFDPRRAAQSAENFSLKYPEEPDPQEPYDLTQHTHLHVQPDSPVGRLKVRSGAAAEHVAQTMQRLGTDLAGDVELNLGRLKDALNAEKSADIVIRPLRISAAPPLRAYIVYVDGIVDSTALEEAILEPLLELGRCQTPVRGVPLLELVESTLVASRQTEQIYQLSTVVESVVAGQVALLLESVPGALLLEARAWPGRGVEKPITEAVAKGPHEAFTETIRTNSALIRRRLMTPDLVFEPGQLGRRSRSYIYLAYLKSVVSEDLLRELRRRLSQIDVDVVIDSGVLQQYLEDSQKGLFPTIGYTERPDRVAAAIAEGRVGLMVDGSPYVVIVPWLFGDYFRISEDYYVKWPFGTLLRIIRIMGAVITLTLPALYIAIANFHHEMIPSALLLAIAASREAVPFPAPLEVVMMEAAFEIIREGSLRIPSMLGQTVGIVGALILGQAAVQAAIVSPILVIVVALTALGSFTIPNYEMSMVLRFLRFGFIILATAGGLYGIALGLLVLSAHAASLRSLGVPYLAPSGPRIPGSPDVIARAPLSAMDRRSDVARPKDKRREARKVIAPAPGKADMLGGNE